MENSFHFFPLWKWGMKGDLTAFQKAKLLLSFHFNRSVFEEDKYVNGGEFHEPLFLSFHSLSFYP